MLWALLIFAVCAVASGISAWLLGRTLLPYRDDPVLPERLELHRKRLGLLVILPPIACGVAIAIFDQIRGGEGWVPSVEWIPALVVYLLASYLAVAVGDLPSRRKLLGETWGVGGYLEFSFRVVVGLFGFWLVVLLAPFIVHQAVNFRWAAGCILLLLLVAWSRNYAYIAVTALRSVPIASEELLNRFDRVMDRSDAQHPEILKCGPNDGGWSNAIAFASLTLQPKVLFSAPLLEILNVEETAAIFAHEAAHLEDFDVPFLKRARLIEWSIAGVGCLSVPVLETLLPGAADWILWAWIPLIFGLLILRMRDMQKRETQSDLRAVELCENPEALVGGLVKLYTANKLPRRMAVEVESNASHPSLARRIRDIRAIRGEDGEPSRSEGEPAGDPTGVGVRRSEGDAVGVVALAGFGAAIFGVLAMGSGALGIGAALLLLVAAIPAVGTRNRPWVGAIGGMALLQAVGQLVASLDRVWWEPSGYAFVALMGVCGGWCVYESFRREERGSSEYSLKRGSPVSVGIAFLLVGLVFSVPRLTGSHDGNIGGRLYSLGIHSKGSFLPFVGAGFALLHQSSPVARLLSLPLLAAGLSHHWFGSERFLTSVANDALAVEVPAIEWRPAPYEEAQRLKIEGKHWGIALSPGADWFFTLPAFEEHAGEYFTNFRISDLSGNAFNRRALAIAFAARGRMISLEEGEVDLELRLFACDEPENTLWRLALQDVDKSSELGLSASGRAWRLVVGAGDERTVRLSGELGSDFVYRKTWTKHSSAGHFRYLGTGARLLDVARGGPARGEPVSGERLFWLFHNYHSPTRLQFLANSEPLSLADTLLWVDCREGGAGEDRIACLAEGPRHSWAWMANPESGSFQSLMRSERHFDWAWDGARLAIVEKNNLRLYFLHSDNGVLIPLPETGDWSQNLDVAGDYAALLRNPSDDSADAELVVLKIPAR